VSDTQFEIRPARESDRVPLAVLFAAVAEERDWIATEPPVDIEERAASWNLDETLVAAAGEEIIGSLGVQINRHGFGEIGMAVAPEWRGRGAGSALVAAAIEWARGRGLHKLSLSVFPHNAAAIALYSKFGFVEEGLRVKQIRRASGELWDVIDMGLLPQLGLTEGRVRERPLTRAARSIRASDMLHPDRSGIVDFANGAVVNRWFNPVRLEFPASDSPGAARIGPSLTQLA
jgi:RimJ/RimL family protein N-acetyltransferase